VMLMYTNLRQAGVGGLTTSSRYWSSSEASATNAWAQNAASIESRDKDAINAVRPVRAF